MTAPFTMPGGRAGPSAAPDTPGAPDAGANRPRTARDGTVPHDPGAAGAAGGSHQPGVGGGPIVRVAHALPSGWASVRVRLSLLYSAVVFGLGAILVALVYIGLTESLRKQPVTDEVVIPVPGRASCFLMRDNVVCVSEARESEAVNEWKVFEKAVNQRALERFRLYSFSGLGGLFLVSLVVGWVLSGRVLRPIDRITTVARDIGATDLSRRIRLEGPDDELKAMADTFDDMLDRIDGAFEDQRRFIHEASHELRNPIAVIRTNVEVALADERPTAEELQDTLTVVGRAADRIAVLVDDLLVYARRESPADRETVVDVASIVADSVAEFAAPAEARGVRLVGGTAPGLTVHGDPVALKQALANLLANAVRLAPPGSSVQAACGREGSWVWMAVQDEGPGISAQDQPRVFERFYRGDPGRARAEGRSGLGLTIVQQIAKGHGGSVGLRSEPGSGSTFSVWLPALGAGDEPTTAGPERVPAGGDAARLGHEATDE